jgi:hypothetical protein
MMKRHTDHAIPLLCLAVLALSSWTTGCSEDAEPPTKPASIEAVGTITAPIEGCDIEGAERPDAGADAGADAAGDAGADVGGDDTWTAATMTKIGDRLLSIPYVIQDPEGDDQEIQVQVCSWDDGTLVDCGFPVQGSGGDGTSNIPTTPAGACVLHVFHWNVACGRFLEDSSREHTDVEDEIVVRMQLADDDDNWTTSEPFTLGDEGIDFETVPPCEN